MIRILIFICITLGAYVCEAQVVELDLQKCRKMAVEYSRELQSAEQQDLKAGYEKKVYRAHFLPKISATGLYAYVQKKLEYKIDGGYLPTYIPGADGQLKPNLLLNPSTGQPMIGADGNYLFNQYAFMPDINLVLGIQNAYTVGLMLEQPLYMGGKVRSAFRMASIGQEIAELNVRYHRSEVITKADEAYWQYLRVKEQSKAAGKYLEVVKELVNNVKDACQTGMASQNDLLKAQVRQNEAELMVQKANNGMVLTGMNLCRVIGVDLYSTLVVTDSLQEQAFSGVLDSKDDVSARPEYNMLEKQVELKGRQVELTRSDYLPQLGLAATYGYGDGIKLNGGSEAVASFAAIASLKVPVYHWGEGRNKVKAMKAEEEMARLQKDETTRLMQLEIAKARYNVEDANARVLLTRKSLMQAEENLQVSKNRFEVGMETLTNYLEAQAQWQKTWSDWIDARAELRLSETLYLKTTGRLDD